MTVVWVRLGTGQESDSLPDHLAIHVEGVFTNAITGEARITYRPVPAHDLLVHSHRHISPPGIEHDHPHPHYPGDATK